MSECHFQHNSRMGWPGIESGYSRWQPGDQPTEPRHEEVHTAVMLIYYDRELKVTCVFNDKMFVSDLLQTDNSVKTINHTSTKNI